MYQQNFPTFGFPSLTGHVTGSWQPNWAYGSNPHGYFLCWISFWGNDERGLWYQLVGRGAKSNVINSTTWKEKETPGKRIQILKKQMLEQLSTPETPWTNGTCIVRWFRKVARWYYTAGTRKRSRVQIHFSSLCVWKGQLEAVRCETLAWNGESYISVRLAEPSSSKIEVGRDWVQLV